MMLSTSRPVATHLVTAPPVHGSFKTEWATTRYKAKKGRAVKKAERTTYDRATAAMLAGAIESWHVYEDGWTFTIDGTETEAMSLAAAGAFIDELGATDIRVAA